jgi:hypothetical protein
MNSAGEGSMVAEREREGTEITKATNEKRWGHKKKGSLGYR